MFFSFFGIIFFILKFFRFIFIILSFEFMMMGLFFELGGVLISYLFFFFLSISVISSVLGMSFMVYVIKSSGSEKVLF